MTFDDLDSASREAAIAGFVDDFCTVVAHVLCDRWAYPWNRKLDALADSVEHRTLPPLPLLGEVVAWTLYTQTWHEAHRRLTTEELEIRAAARRLSDALPSPLH